jgi:LuxR family maltose regulon positive regulatory protein
MALSGGDVDAAEVPLDAAEGAFGAAGESRSSRLRGWATSLLANIPAAIALDRAYLASLRGDAERTARGCFAALAELGEGERAQSSSIARWLAVGERYLAI